jgi:hypothetical protein
MYEIINLVKTIENLKYLNREHKEQFTYQVLHATCSSIAGVEGDSEDLKKVLTQIDQEHKKVNDFMEKFTAEDVSAEYVIAKEVTAEDVSDEVREEQVATVATDKNDCYACNNTRISYWSDDIYGPCMECCCIDCEKLCSLCRCDRLKLAPKKKKKEDCVEI